MGWFIVVWWFAAFAFSGVVWWFSVAFDAGLGVTMVFPGGLGGFGVWR